MLAPRHGISRLLKNSSLKAKSTRPQAKLVAIV
jgi:hypothetical protein